MPHEFVRGRQAKLSCRGERPRCLAAPAPRGVAEKRAVRRAPIVVEPKLTAPHDRNTVAFQTRNFPRRGSDVPGAVIFNDNLRDRQKLGSGRCPRILVDSYVHVHCLASRPPTPTSAPHHSALTGQSARGELLESLFEARFHATTSECCEGKTSAGRYKAICR